jgi:hypothetical protein
LKAPKAGAVFTGTTRAVVLNTDSYINATGEVVSSNFVGVKAASATWPSDFYGAMQCRSSQTAVSFIKKSGDQLTLTNKAFLWEQMTSTTTANELMSLTNGGVLNVPGGITSPTLVSLQNQINSKAESAGPIFSGTVQLDTVNVTQYINATGSIYTGGYLCTKGSSASLPAFAGAYSSATAIRNGNNHVSFLKTTGDTVSANKAFGWENMSNASTVVELMSLTNAGNLAVSGSISSPTLTALQTQVNTHTTAADVNGIVTTRLATTTFGDTTVTGQLQYRSARMSTAVISSDTFYTWFTIVSVVKLAGPADVFVPSPDGQHEGTTITIFSNNIGFSLRGGGVVLTFGPSYRSRMFTILDNIWVCLDFA